MEKELDLIIHLHSRTITIIRLELNKTTPSLPFPHLTEINDLWSEKKGIKKLRQQPEQCSSRETSSSLAHRLPWQYAARRRSLVLINAVMATQIPPLDNSFCNYADDTPGGHFEMNIVAQRCGLHVFHTVKG